MIDQVDLSLVNWARAQFALTAMYHWLFVPLTLGLTFLIAFFETIYVKTGSEQWKELTRFWMKLFGINFAIGVATGIILEFEFGTNWSNYSWMVGDIFGAPLAIEGIVAFFLEATFFAVMFFGWNRVSKGFHLLSTWMVAIGSNLSALWILVANGWMQHPTGMAFNPDTARFEMQNFFDIILSPYAISKFTHATTSGFALSSFFVIAVSSYYLAKKRHVLMAKRSIAVASVFGLVASLMLAYTGDEAAFLDAKHQPMKLAAMEGLWEGTTNAPIVAVGIINGMKRPGDFHEPFVYEVKIPGMLSLLANRQAGSFVPGINDLVYGNKEQGIMGATDKVEKGRLAVKYLADYKHAQKEGDIKKASAALVEFKKYQQYLGYGHLKSPEEAVPPVPLTFYSFHMMAAVGSAMILILFLYFFYTARGKLEEVRWLYPVGILFFFLAYAAGEAGWVVAEVGRQPWAIQGLLPVSVARTDIAPVNVKLTFFMFLATFTLLLIAEVKIMLKQIQIGPKEVA
ncbi:MAG: cytochrome ubiquinol oxidase subunit I [Thermodesulfatator sp.]|nr:MAG: cytochrome ubiquinol oxidase subunit I [Thermodesulfatator sp.]